MCGGQVLVPSTPSSDAALVGGLLVGFQDSATCIAVVFGCGLVVVLRV